VILGLQQFHQIGGNHLRRASRRILEAVPDLEHFFDFSKIVEFDGVENFFNDRDIIMLTPTIELTHGDHSSRMINYANERGHNVVKGHDHRGSIDYTTTLSGKQLWCASAGHLADIETVPMQYTMKSKPNWQRGILLIDSLGPRFISL